MKLNDNFCTIVPYFKINDGALEQAKSITKQLVSLTQKESGCLFYNFTFNDQMMHCREGYVSALALLEHIENTKTLIDELLSISEIVQLEVHGPRVELQKLHEHLAAMSPVYYYLDE